MKSVVSFIVVGLLLVGCAQKPASLDPAVIRVVTDGPAMLKSRMSETNLLVGAIAELQLELMAPAELEVEFKKLAFDGFLVFAEEHPAYVAGADGRLLYRHIYHLQARAPGIGAIPEIKVRTTRILGSAEPHELVQPALPVTVRGIDVKQQDVLQWARAVEVSL